MGMITQYMSVERRRAMLAELRAMQAEIDNDLKHIAREMQVQDDTREALILVLVSE